MPRGDRFSRRAELDGDRAAAELTFWGRCLRKLTPAEARESMEFGELGRDRARWARA